MSEWNPKLYMQFQNERTQPAIDLISRLDVSDPQTIIDLGCGPGNSTEMLRRRWPEAKITGLDSSSEMIEAAKTNYPQETWFLSDLATWKTDTPCDIVFSNAALHWLPGHDKLVTHLLDQVAPGGALAFQIPTSSKSLLHPLILQTADEVQWRTQMAAAKNVMTSESPAFYYDALQDKTSSLAIWETEYCHVMENHAAILEWISSTRLRPFLDCLDGEDQKARFNALLAERLHAAYPTQKDGKVLFPFRRLFVIAYR